MIVSIASITVVCMVNCLPTYFWRSKSEGPSNSVTIKLVELDIMINDIAIVVYTYDDSKNN